MTHQWLVGLGLGLTAITAPGIAGAASVQAHIPADTVLYNGITAEFDKAGLAAAYGAAAPMSSLAEGDRDPAEATQEGGPGAGMFAALAADYNASWAEDDQPLARFGVAADGEYALYTVGALPVIRVAVEDPKAFRSRLQAAQQAAAIEPERTRSAGIRTRRYPFEMDEDEGNLELVVTVHDGHGVITLAGDGIPDDALAIALGAEEPATSLAERKRPSNLTERHEFVEGSVGYIDHEAIIAGLTNAEANRFGRMIRPLMEAWGEGDSLPFAAMRNEACHNEATEWAATWPYSSSGYTDVDADADRVQTRNLVRVHSEFVRNQLANLRGRIPTVTEAQPLMEFGLGLRIQEVIPTLRQLAERFKQVERDCGLLRKAQKAVHEQSIGQLEIVSRTLGDTRGMTATLVDVKETPGGSADSSDDSTATPQGVIEIATSDPAGLWRLVASGLGLGNQAPRPKPGGEPVSFEAGMGLDADWQAAIRNNSLVMLVGGAPLPDMAGETGLQPNGVLRLRENVARLAEIAGREDGMLPDSVAEQGMLGLTESLNAYLDTRLDVTKRGIAFDVTLTPAP